MKLTPDERAERALWLCEALDGLRDHNDLTKEIVKERRMQARALEQRIAKLQREVATGESEAEQLAIEGA